MNRKYTVILVASVILSQAVLIVSLVPGVESLGFNGNLLASG